MIKYEIGKIVNGVVSGVEKYGAFVSLDEYYNGLIHISEIGDGYIYDINEYLKVGDHINAKVIGVDEEEGHIKLSLKGLSTVKKGLKSKKRKIIETGEGFKSLEEKLPEWISEYKNK